MGFTADSNIHAVAEMSVWVNSGTATSQIYDTKMAAPVYGQLSWATNGSGTYTLKVRSSSSSQMIGAPAWSSVSDATNSPSGLGSVTALRYVQFQTTLTMPSPYTTYPKLDNVAITWPGQTALVEFSGRYTLRPNYGIFKVLVDNLTIVNALQADLTVSKSYQNKTHSVSLSAEAKPKNTGK